MDSTVIEAAIITGVATVTAAVIAVVKKKSKEPASFQDDVSESNVAIGSNITQTYQGATHNYYGTGSPSLGPFHGKVASKPSLIEIFDAIETAKPYDKIQISRNYVGQLISSPVVFCAVNCGHDGVSWDVTFKPSDRYFPVVCASIDIEEHPKLKVIDSGHPSWIEGLIKSAEGSMIFLEANPKIWFE